jgi:ABC-type glycerol-3-phosphate transport system substrate-binding protein
LQPQLEHALNRYAEEHPQVRLQTVSHFVQADLLITGTSRAYQLWADHHSLPLDDRLAECGLGERDFWPATMAAARVGDRLFAVPYTWCPFVMVYHRGLTGTSDLETWTLDTLRDWVRTHGGRLAAQGQRAISHYRGFNSQVLPFLVRHGASLVSDDGVRSLLHKREALQAFRYCRDLVAPMHALAPRTICGISDLYEGRLAIRLGNAEAYVAAQRQGRHDIRFAPLPRQVGRESRLNGEWLCLGARGPNPDGAWHLLRWLIDEPQQQRLAQAGYTFPGRRFAIEQLIAHAACPDILRLLLDFTYRHPHVRFDDLLFLDECLDGWWTHDDLPALLAATADKLNVRLFTATASDEMLLI